MYRGNSIFDDFKNAWQKPNNATAQLIIINVVVFIFLGLINLISTIGNFPSLISIVHDQFSIPPSLEEFIYRPWTLITYSFSHSLSRLMHIIMNMLTFYWFSKVILEFLGNRRIISLYVLGAIGGGLFYLLAYNLIPFFIDRSIAVPGMVGASAAVYAIVVAAAVLVPDYTFFLLLLGPVRIKYIAFFFVVISLLSSAGTNAGGEIAHLGGAFAGWLFVVQLRKGNDIGKWVLSVIDWTKGLFAPRPKIKVTHKKTNTKRSKSANGTTTSSSSSASGNQVDQATIDKILDKISQSGYDSLTKEEKQQLFNYGKK